MSRIGKKIIEIPGNVNVRLDGNLIFVKGPKGELKKELHPAVRVSIDGTQLQVTVEKPEDNKQNALWGLFRSIISNMVFGVANGYEKKLEINGIGYKAAVSGRNLILNVGYSHPVEFALPEGINCVVEKNIVTINGADKQVVGEVAAQIRRVRKPEPYLGKGIKYLEEVIRRKAGKTATKAAA
jgi:large subunit ribosomal protein L6